MPPTKEMIEEAMKCLANTEVQSFTASPATIRPGDASTLNWRVAIPGGCQGMKLFLNTSNGSPISKSGSRSVEPAITTVYSLIGRMHTVEQSLDAVTVAIDTSQCIIQSLDEETVRQKLRSLIEASLAGSPLSQRSPANVEIDRNGIAVRLRLRVDVPNFFDPDLNVDLVIAVKAANNNVVTSYRSYSNDVDWPWWVTGITLGITEFIEGVIESRIEQKIKPLILQQVKEQIESYLSLLPSTYRLHSLTTEPDEIRALICRRPGAGTE